MPDNLTTASLPYVDLRGVSVSEGVLRLIPLPTADKFQVVAFALGDTVLKLALAHPEQLKQGFFVALEDIGKKIGRKVELYRTDPSSMQVILKQYASLPANGAAVAATPATPAPAPAAAPTAVAPTAVPGGGPVPASTVAAPAVATGTEATGQEQIYDSPKPPLFQLGRTVAFNYLLRIPYDFAVAHRLVCVDYLPPNVYWFAADGRNQKDVEQIVPFIENNNHIKIHLMKVSSRDLDGLLDYYASQIKVEEEKKAREAAQKANGGTDYDEIEQQMRRVAQTASQVTEPEKVVPLAEGVVVPQVQATIMDAEEEKPGLAGLFQRFSKSFTPKHEEDQNASDAPGSGLTPQAAIPGIVGAGQAAPTPGLTVAAGGAMPAAPTAAVSPAGATADTPSTPTPSPTGESTAVAGAAVAPTVTSGAAVEKIEKKDGKSRTSMAETEAQESQIGRLLPKPVLSLSELEEHVKGGYIPRIVAAIVSYAINEKASDIHMEVFQDQVRVRYRIDGQLFEIIKLPPDIHAAMVSRIKILSHLRLDETRVPQDGRFDVEVNNKQIDLRVSIMPTVHGEKVVMRILEKNKGVNSLDSLGMLGLGYLNLLKAVNKPFGICLATGPTGSGKSTSLYAILTLIATSNVNVITLEDPVEYEMSGINQSQIRPKIGFTFAEGLRSILRQDPNIIMVGEIRDGETANMATQAALTGHLVLSTLHTNDAAGAIPRLTNMGIEPFLITSSLNVAMGQRLVRRICPKCKTEVDIPAGVKDEIARQIDAIAQVSPKDSARAKPPYHFYQGAGCDECRGKGYQGRIGIYEVLIMSEAVEELTLQHASGTQIQEQAQKEGMITMYQDGLLKVVNGITTLDEVLRETSNK